jgi:Domain of unknown function (DUF4160)
MPTILKVGPYRFFFYSNENNEPPNIHVERDSETAKFWLEPVSLAMNDGFSGKELRTIHLIVIENCNLFVRTYKEYHG